MWFRWVFLYFSAIINFQTQSGYVENLAKNKILKYCHINYEMRNLKNFDIYFIIHLKTEFK